ncbi:MAG: hypothetical protein AAF733_04650 [Verrucomicrobiota bacterium]
MSEISRREETTVIVVGCGTGGLAVIRSLGRRPGFRIIAASHKKHSVGFFSKYAAKQVLVPNAVKQEKEFVEFFLERGEEWKGAILLEVTDDAAIALSKHKKELSEHYHIATAEWSIVQKFLEKSSLYKLADECGVPHPKTFTPASREECEEVANQVAYPCIIKPVYSHEFVGEFGAKMFHARDAEELLKNLEKCIASRIRVMVQEVVVGPESNLERLQVYVNRAGRISSRFFNNKLRQHPPNFGVMRVGTSMPRNREVENLSERILTHGNYRGYASVEFKRDCRDGQLKLIEINVRMPRNGWLAITSGVDFPWIIIQDLLQNESIDVKEYKEGQYWIEIFSELRNLLPRRGEKWMGLRSLLRPYFAKNRVFAVLSVHDPGPFLFQIRHAISRTLGLR